MSRSLCYVTVDRHLAYQEQHSNHSNVKVTHCSYVIKKLQWYIDECQGQSRSVGYWSHHRNINVKVTHCRVLSSKKLQWYIYGCQGQSRGVGYGSHQRNINVKVNFATVISQ